MRTNYSEIEHVMYNNYISLHHINDKDSKFKIDLNGFSNNYQSKGELTFNLTNKVLMIKEKESSFLFDISYFKNLRTSPNGINADLNLKISLYELIEVYIKKEDSEIKINYDNIYSYIENFNDFTIRLKDCNESSYLKLQLIKTLTKTYFTPKDERNEEFIIKNTFLDKKDINLINFIKNKDFLHYIIEFKLFYTNVEKEAMNFLRLIREIQKYEVKTKMKIAEKENLADEFQLSKPKEYQIELLEEAKKQNSIIFLETGMGKTYIAILLAIDVLKQQVNYKKKKAIFLFKNINLLLQQSNVIKSNTDGDLKTMVVYGGENLSSLTRFQKKSEKYDIICSTPELMYKLFTYGFIDTNNVALIIFDECHHCRSNDFFNLLMQHFIDPTLTKILGLTASPCAEKTVDPKKIKKSIQELCTNLNSKLIYSKEASKLISESFGYESVCNTEIDNDSLIINNSSKIKTSLISTKKYEYVKLLEYSNISSTSLFEILSTNNVEKITDHISSLIRCLSNPEECKKTSLSDLILSFKLNVLIYVSKYTKHYFAFLDNKNFSHADKLIVLYNLILTSIILSDEEFINEKINGIFTMIDIRLFEGLTKAISQNSDSSYLNYLVGKLQETSDQDTTNKRQVLNCSKEVQVINKYIMSSKLLIKLKKIVKKINLILKYLDFESLMIELRNDIRDFQNLYSDFNKCKDQNMEELNTMLRRLEENKNQSDKNNLISNSNTIIVNEENNLSLLFDYQSDYLRNTLFILKEKVIGTNEKSIIFVSERILAKILSSTIKRKLNLIDQVPFILGLSNSNSEQKFTEKDLNDNLERFKNSNNIEGIGALIATSVAEEGIDIPQCSIVISLEKVDTMKELVQKSGRARKEQAIIYLFCNDEVKKYEEHILTLINNVKLIKELIEKGDECINPGLRNVNYVEGNDYLTPNFLKNDIQTYVNFVLAPMSNENAKIKYTKFRERLDKEVEDYCSNNNKNKLDFLKSSNLLSRMTEKQQTELFRKFLNTTTTTFKIYKSYCKTIINEFCMNLYNDGYNFIKDQFELSKKKMKIKKKKEEEKKKKTKESDLKLDTIENIEIVNLEDDLLSRIDTKEIKNEKSTKENSNTVTKEQKTINTNCNTNNKDIEKKDDCEEEEKERYFPYLSLPSIIGKHLQKITIDEIPIDGFESEDKAREFAKKNSDSFYWNALIKLVCYSYFDKNLIFKNAHDDFLNTDTYQSIIDGETKLEFIPQIPQKESKEKESTELKNNKKIEYFISFLDILPNFIDFDIEEDKNLPDYKPRKIAFISEFQIPSTYFDLNLPIRALKQLYYFNSHYDLDGTYINSENKNEINDNFLNKDKLPITSNKCQMYAKIDSSVTIEVDAYDNLYISFFYHYCMFFCSDSELKFFLLIFLKKFDFNCLFKECFEELELIFGNEELAINLLEKEFNNTFCDTDFNKLDSNFQSLLKYTIIKIDGINNTTGNSVYSIDYDYIKALLEQTKQLVKKYSLFVKFNSIANNIKLKDLLLDFNVDNLDYKFNSTHLKEFNNSILREKFDTENTITKEIISTLKFDQSLKRKKFLGELIKHFNYDEEKRKNKESLISQKGNVYMNLINFSKVIPIIQNNKSEVRGKDDLEINDLFRNRYILKKLKKYDDQISLEKLNKKIKENKIRENKKGKRTQTFQEYFLDRYEILINEENSLEACFVVNFHNEVSNVKFWRKLGSTDLSEIHRNHLNSKFDERNRKYNDKEESKKVKSYNEYLEKGNIVKIKETKVVKTYTKLKPLVRLPKEALFQLKDISLDKLYIFTLLPIISSMIYNFFVYYYEFHTLKKEFLSFRKLNRMNISYFKNALTTRSADYFNNYEQFEFLGDSILKFLSSYEVFVKYPLGGKDLLYSKRKLIESNKNLFYRAKVRYLERFLKTTKFSFKKIRIPGLKPAEISFILSIHDNRKLSKAILNRENLEWNNNLELKEQIDYLNEKSKTREIEKMTLIQNTIKRNIKEEIMNLYNKEKDDDYEKELSRKTLFAIQKELIEKSADYNDRNLIKNVYTEKNKEMLKCNFDEKTLEEENSSSVAPIIELMKAKREEKELLRNEEDKVAFGNKLKNRSVEVEVPMNENCFDNQESKLAFLKSQNNRNIEELELDISIENVCSKVVELPRDKDCRPCSQKTLSDLVESLVGFLFQPSFDNDDSIDIKLDRCYLFLREMEVLEGNHEIIAFKDYMKNNEETFSDSIILSEMEQFTDKDESFILKKLPHDYYITKLKNNDKENSYFNKNLKDKLKQLNEDKGINNSNSKKPFKYVFENEDNIFLLIQALTHSTKLSQFCFEKFPPIVNYSMSRLALLGESIYHFFISHYLYDKYKFETEESLHKLRINSLNYNLLCIYGIELGLDKYIDSNEFVEYYDYKEKKVKKGKRLLYDCQMYREKYDELISKGIKFKLTNEEYQELIKDKVKLEEFKKAKEEAFLELDSYFAITPLEAFFSYLAAVFLDLKNMQVLFDKLREYLHPYLLANSSLETFDEHPKSKIYFLFLQFQDYLKTIREK